MLFSTKICLFKNNLKEKNLKRFFVATQQYIDVFITNKDRSSDTQQTNPIFSYNAYAQYILYVIKS